ncbi:MAG: hypothetical protein Q9174_002047 [Haloplaca sp. 1 TL-2023]
MIPRKGETDPPVIASYIDASFDDYSEGHPETLFTRGLELKKGYTLIKKRDSAQLGASFERFQYTRWGETKINDACEKELASHPEEDIDDHGLNLLVKMPSKPEPRGMKASTMDKSFKDVLEELDWQEIKDQGLATEVNGADPYYSLDKGSASGIGTLTAQA